jgi:hypothetical protein
MVRRLVVLTAAALSLAACSVSIERAGPTAPPQLPVSTPSTEASKPADTPAPVSLARTDNQGAVEFVVEPLNLNESGETLDFSVVMDTHSVDVGWDLAALAMLETGSGSQVGATGWPVGGGHHYGGTLSFPRFEPDGDDLLAGASVLRLIIRGTDVPERVFTWEISP